MMKYLLQTIRLLKNHKLYIYYSLAYGLSTLVVPLGVQFLVNNLALSGLWLNISAFIVFIVIGLTVSQAIRHSQVILSESLQREIFCIESNEWNDFNHKKYSHYYFEVFSLMKSFSKSYSSLIELALVVIFGISTIVMFHPMFLPIAILIVGAIFLIYRSTSKGLPSSIKESDEKYKLYDIVDSEDLMVETDLKRYLEARDVHFDFIRQNSFVVSALLILVQGISLAVGCYLIKVNQLSVGQLVSAEIIISGIFGPLSKLPQTLEAVYDYETSKYKINKVVGLNHA